MHLEMGLLFVVLLNYVLLVAFAAFVISYVRKPTVRKKRILVVLAVCALIGTVGNMLSDDKSGKWFNDSELVYDEITVGKTSYTELLKLHPCAAEKISLSNDGNICYLRYDNYAVGTVNDTVNQISITNTIGQAAIFGVEIGDSLASVKAKLPAELAEREYHDNEISKQSQVRDYGELVSFYLNDELMGQTIFICSRSGKSYIMIDFNDDLQVSEIRYCCFAR